MWWPKLEEEISLILKSNDKVAKKERRSERDILEELLELTRMNSSRSARPRMSERAVMELIESLDELQFVLSHEEEKMGMRILERLERPLRHLCMEAGVPELFERYRIGNRKNPRSLGERLNERTSETIAPKDLVEVGR